MSVADAGSLIELGGDTVSMFAHQTTVAGVIRGGLELTYQQAQDYLFEKAFGHGFGLIYHKLPAPLRSLIGQQIGNLTDAFIDASKACAS